MDVSTQAEDALLMKPSGDKPDGFLGEALVLMRRSDHPREFCDRRWLARLDGGLHRADRVACCPLAHGPVQPAIESIWRSSSRAALETKAKLLDTDRSATGEAVERDVIEHRGKLISVLGAKRLQHQPL